MEQTPTAIADARPLSIERHMWTSTTVRNWPYLRGRLQALVSEIASINSSGVQSRAEVHAALGQLWGVDTGVVTQVMGAARAYGLAEVLDEADDDGNWIVSYPALEHLLGHDDEAAFLADLQLRQPASSGVARRWAVAVLNFLDEARHLEGVDAWAIAALVAPATKEGPWTREVARAASMGCEEGVRHLQRRIGGRVELRRSVERRLRELFGIGAHDEAAVAAVIYEHRSELMPRARATGARELAVEVAGLVAANRFGTAAARIVEVRAAKLIDSHRDHVGSGLRFLEDAGLVRRSASGGYAITGFGTEALVGLGRCPSAASSVASMRNLRETRFAGRGAKRSERFAELIAADRSGPGRERLADSFAWGRFAGRKDAGGYEIAGMRCAWSLLDIDAASALGGCRTVLDYDFSAQSHAPGQGPDGIIDAGELVLAMEFSGLEGNHQAARELESVCRHVRELDAQRSEAVVGVLVCPSISVRTVSHLLCEAHPDWADEGDGECIVVALDEDQLRRLVAAGADLAAVLAAASGAVRSAAAQSSSPLVARQLLERIEELVEAGESAGLAADA